MKPDKIFSAGSIALAFCLASAPGAVADVVLDLRDTDVVLVFRRDISEVRWFRAADCPDFKKIPILTRLYGRNGNLRGAVARRDQGHALGLFLSPGPSPGFLSER